MVKSLRVCIYVFLSICIVCATVLYATSAPSPTAEIKSTIDAILEVLKDDKLRSPANKMKRRSIIRTLFEDRFDFMEMSKRSLARHWKDRTPEEKKEFITLFSRLLESSYISRIESYTNEKITYDRETVKGNGKYAVVSTSIKTDTADIPIEYRVILKKNKWWVYDVVIEGVSFISTYRSQYNKIIRSKSYARLITEMKTKLEKINSESDKKPAP